MVTPLPSRLVRVLARARTLGRGLALRALLPLLLPRRRLDELLASLDRGAPGVAPDDVQRWAERLFRPLRFWPTTCLFRALGGYALLRSAGQDVRFVLGVRKDGAELVAHAWLERDGKPSLGAPRPEDGFTVAYAWPADRAMLARAQEVARMSGITPSDDAVLTELQDGTGVLLHLGTQFYFTLNRTGVLTWKLLAQGARDAPELASQLAAIFPGADAGAVRADVDALLAELTREALVTVRP